MNPFLQAILLIGAIAFFIFVVTLVRKNHLQVKYSLMWLFISVAYILLAIFPNLLQSLANVLHIYEKVNSLFLITIFFILVLCFTFNLIISGQNKKIKHLIQEVSILKSKQEQHDQLDSKS